MLLSAINERTTPLIAPDLKLLQDCLLSEITAYQDFYIPTMSYEIHPTARDVVTLHALNHIMRYDVLSLSCLRPLIRDLSEKGAESSRTMNALHRRPRNRRRQRSLTSVTKALLDLPS